MSTIVISLRRATPADAPAMWAVRADAVRRTCRGHYPDELIDRWSSSPMPDTFPSNIEKEYFVIGEMETRVVGFAALKASDAEIDAVFVTPDAGRQGLGRRMLAHLEDAALRSGLQALSVKSSLNAVPFYGAAGYRPTSEGIYTTSAGVQIAYVLMEKSLTD